MEIFVVPFPLYLSYLHCSYAYMYIRLHISLHYMVIEILNVCN